MQIETLIEVYTEPEKKLSLLIKEISEVYDNPIFDNICIYGFKYVKCQKLDDGYKILERSIDFI